MAECVPARHWFVFVCYCRAFHCGSHSSSKWALLLSSEKRALRGLESADWTFPITGFGSISPVLIQLCLRLTSGSRFSKQVSISLISTRGHLKPFDLHRGLYGMRLHMCSVRDIAFSLHTENVLLCNIDVSITCPLCISLSIRF